jgi:hypothetical protein
MRLTRQIAKEMAFEAVVFGTGCAEMALFYGNNLLLTALVAATIAAELAFWPRRRTVAFLITGCIVGPSAEALCVWAGAWHYANPTLLGIPLWLPAGWGCVTVLIMGIVDTAAKLRPPRAGNGLSSP